MSILTSLFFLFTLYIIFCDLSWLVLFLAVTRRCKLFMYEQSAHCGLFQCLYMLCHTCFTVFSCTEAKFFVFTVHCSLQCTLVLYLCERNNISGRVYRLYSMSYVTVNLFLFWLKSSKSTLILLKNNLLTCNHIFRVKVTSI